MRVRSRLTAASLGSGVGGAMSIVFTLGPSARAQGLMSKKKRLNHGEHGEHGGSKRNKTHDQLIRSRQDGEARRVRNAPTWNAAGQQPHFLLFSVSSVFSVFQSSSLLLRWRLAGLSCCDEAEPERQCEPGRPS